MENKPEVMEGSQIHSAIVDTPLSVEDVKKKWTHLQEMRDAILDKSDVVKLQSKTYRLKSSYRKLAFIYNLTDTILKADKEMKGDKDFVWRFQVRVIAPNGRAAMGIGACDSTERKFAHPEHDVYAMAHTRAKNRAISDILGLGEVSAEEMGFDTPVAKPVQPQTQSDKNVLLFPRNPQGFNATATNAGEKPSEKQNKYLDTLLKEDVKAQEYFAGYLETNDMSREDMTKPMMSFVIDKIKSKTYDEAGQQAQS